jgi:hypothetical protein
MPPLRWKALEAFVAAFAPVVGKPTYKASFKFIIAQQIRHQITVAANSENEARTIALAERARPRAGGAGSRRSKSWRMSRRPAPVR